MMGSHHWPEVGYLLSPGMCFIFHFLLGRWFFPFLLGLYLDACVFVAIGMGSLFDERESVLNRRRWSRAQTLHPSPFNLSPNNLRSITKGKPRPTIPILSSIHRSDQSDQTQPSQSKPQNQNQLTLFPPSPHSKRLRNRSPPGIHPSLFRPHVLLLPIPLLLQSLFSRANFRLHRSRDRQRQHRQPKRPAQMRFQTYSQAGGGFR